MLVLRSNLTNRISDLENNKYPIPEEVQSKLAQVTSRLFEIFIQKEDMLKFSYDFADIEATLGPANNTQGSISEWNNMLLEKRELYQNIDEILSSFNPNKKQKMQLDEKKRVIVVDDDEGDADADESASTEKKEGSDEVEGGVISDEEFLQSASEKESYLNVELSRDHDGHIWSTVIVHEDQTQVVTAGGRVLSYRILLTIGNLRGVGGYGMGKGSSPQLALNSAFRFVHISLSLSFMIL